MALHIDAAIHLNVAEVGNAGDGAGGETDQDGASSISLIQIGTAYSICALAIRGEYRAQIGIGRKLGQIETCMEYVRREYGSKQLTDPGFMT